MRSVLVTGGTGSFGRAFVRRLLECPPTVCSVRGESSWVERGVDRVVVFSRDELKQHQMRADGFTDERLRFFIGDVRDRDRLRRAMAGVDVVVHAAALKQVDTCELNPLEAKKTNVDGTSNVIDAALDAGVSKVLALGTDKAVDPTNLYGATKLVAEKLVVDANVYSGAGGTLFAGTRYGNVVGSRGSVVPVFERLVGAGLPLTVTEPGMTRFVMTLPQCVAFVLDAIRGMRGGEVFVPKLPAVTIETVAAAVSWPLVPEIRVTGLRPGEKRHEVLLSEHEMGRTRDLGWCFVVAPLAGGGVGGVPVVGSDGYSSDRTRLLSVEEFRRLAGLAANVREAV